jgi:signal transduction histidine kinase
MRRSRPKPSAPADTTRGLGRIWRQGRLLTILLVFALTALRLWDPSPLSAARLGFFDLLQQMSQKPAPASPVAVINIDEASLARFGQWPWARGRIAELVTAAADQGAKVVGFTILFAEPERSVADLISAIPDLPADIAARLLGLGGDIGLAKSFGRVPVVLGTVIDEPVGTRPLWSDAKDALQDGVFSASRDPRDFLPAYRRAIGNLPLLEDASALSGALVVTPDTAGIIREAPLAVRVAGKIVPSLAAAMVRIGSGAKLDLRISSWGIGAVQTPGGLLPTDRGGDIWLAYARPDARRYVSAATLLQGESALDALRGKYVLIGTTVAGLAEYHATPLGTRLPGIEIQAQILDSLLTGHVLHRPLALAAAEIAAPLAVALFGLFLVRGGRLPPFAGLSTIGVLALFPLAWLLHAQVDLLLDPIYPATASLLVAGFLVVTEIVAARRAAERAVQEREARLRELQVEILGLSRIAAIEQMSSALAHELNQPLAAIANFTQASLRLLKQDGDQSGKVGTYLEKAVGQVDRAAAIIAGLRNLVQRGETTRAPEDVNSVVTEAVETAFIGAPAGPISVAYELAPSLPPAPINRIQIQQVILNLVRNAVEAMRPQGQGKLTIGTALTDDAIEVSIADTGPGVPPEFEEQLFKPFATTKDTGMGIGLSISRSIVTAHDGELHAARNAEGGMIFRFTLPLSETADEAAGET